MIGEGCTSGFLWLAQGSPLKVRTKIRVTESPESSTFWPMVTEVIVSCNSDIAGWLPELFTVHRGWFPGQVAAGYMSKFYFYIWSFSVCIVNLSTL